MRITLTNDFHRTTVNLNLKGDHLSPGQVKRAKLALCGMAGCSCSGAMGNRGPGMDHPDDPSLYLMHQERADGGMDVWFANPWE